MNITDIAWYVGLAILVGLWAFAAVYFAQSVAAIFSVYSTNGRVKNVKGATLALRSTYTSLLVVAGIAILNLINWMVAA